MPDPTPEELRAAGFAHNTSPNPRTDLELRLMCAWVGVPPTSVAPGWWHHPNNSTKAAWGRVAAALRDDGPVPDFGAALRADRARRAKSGERRAQFRI